MGSRSSSRGSSSPVHGGGRFEDFLTAIDAVPPLSPLSGYGKPTIREEEEEILYIHPLSLLIDKGEAWAEC